MMRYRVALSVATLAAAGFLTACADQGSVVEDGAKSIQALTSSSGPKSYIVRVRDGVDLDATVDDLVARHGVSAIHRYRHVFRGASLLVPTDAARAALAADPRIAAIDEDRLVFASKGNPHKPPQEPPAPPPQVEPTGFRLIGADVTANEGAGVRVAVLDTGIDIDHPDLSANVDLTYAKDCVNERRVATFDDGDGHGSHVAGTIAAVDNAVGSIGIGTQIKVVPVKVLNKRGSGAWSTIICGIDHVTANAGAIQVANMSLGGTGTECTGTGCTKSALQLAVEASVAAGVTYAVAAGNESDDAANHVPAAYDAVITVSAYWDNDGVLGSGDGWPSFTNYGLDVDLAAPGVYIYSTWKDGGYNTISGTSMASPHVAAASALYLSTHAGATPAEVRGALVAAGVRDYPGSTDPRHPEPLLDVRGF